MSPISCPIVDLSRPSPANLRRYRRRAEKIGGLEFESASGKNFNELFDSLIDLHSARWDRRNDPGVLCERKTRRFHTQAAGALYRHRISRIYALRIDGRIVAG